MLAFVNAAFLGAGANVWGPNTLITGVIVIALIIPVFAYRHYLQDKGQFPSEMLKDLGLQGRDLGVRKAGMLPYLALLGGIAIVVVTTLIFK